MKKILLVVALLVTALLIYSLNVKAAGVVVTNLLTSTNLPTGTNYTASFNPDGRLALLPQTFTFSNKDMNDTNDVSYIIQISFDNTNFVDISRRFYFTATNPAVESFAPVLTTNELYFRVKVIVTNVTTEVLAISSQ